MAWQPAVFVYLRGLTYWYNPYLRNCGNRSSSKKCAWDRNSSTEAAVCFLYLLLVFRSDLIQKCAMACLLYGSLSLRRYEEVDPEGGTGYVGNHCH